ncbi:threonine dehydratase [Rugamonas apoptosis]|uniref:Threonine dehydratase n=1 Tax=Rugamonas apoptosis TaxID=2758570 RepID=A0A7W2F8Q5_9BURK|nr:threonine dehydratase [Rugamonas apoptosis]MBA5687099.1 threonine dehydratase [Rugamonas apoptosis]
MHLPTSSDLDAAGATVYAAMPPTPQYSWPLLNEALGVETWIKHENHTPTGAFKVRGGLVYVAALARRLPGVKGIVLATRGNHGLSLAYAARRHGLQATIVVPRGNSTEKNAGMRALGAQLIEHGADYQASREHALMLAERDGLHMVPSYHPDLMAGVATGWMELLRAQPGLELLLAPIGQGSGICAAVAARNALGLHMPIIGVVSQHALAYQLSFRARRSVESPVTTVLADGLACRVPDPQSLAMILAHVGDVVAVSDEQVAAAMRLYHRATHNVAEGAGAAALAAALALQQDPAWRGRSIGLALTGGNVDTAMLAGVLQGA